MSTTIQPVVVYSNHTCPNCDQLKKALGMKGIAYQEINVGDNPDQAVMLREKGFRQLPVIEDNGNWMTGFTASNFTKIVQARTASVH